MSSPHTLIDAMLDTPATPTGTTTAAVSGGLELSIKKFVLQLLVEKAVSTVVPTRDVMPVLKNVQLHAQPGRLRMTASDMELSIISSTALVDVHVAGVAVFPARKLLNILRCADDGVVRLRVTGRAATITIGHTSWNLMLALGEDFPAMPVIEDLTLTTVPTAQFADALHAVRYAASRGTARANLALVQVANGAALASDGARLAKTGAPVLPGPVHIPIDAVDDLLKLIAGSDSEHLGVGEGGHRLVFTLGDDILIVNQPAAAIPDMAGQLLRPALGNDQLLTLGRDELRKAITRVRINADPHTSAMALTLAGDTLTVSAGDTHDNTAAETITGVGWAGPNRTLTVNHTYLVQALTAITAPTVHLYLGTDTSTRKCAILCRDPDTASVAVIQQMLCDWSTR